MNEEQKQAWYHKNIDYKERVIYFGPWQPSEEMVDETRMWEINDFSIQNLIKGLYILDKEKKANITIIWNSYGGYWTSGMAVYDFIKEIKSLVIMKCYGHVRSMGTIILQSCKKRILSPHCEFMIHYGTDSSEEVHSKDLLAGALEGERCNKIMEKIYLDRIKEKKPRFTLEDLKKLIANDKYLTPKQAIDLGLVDGVIK